MSALTQEESVIDAPGLPALREEQGITTPQSHPAQDMRHAMMRLPVEQQNQVLSEYVERRNNFRRWLREQFEEGLHYGTPPGCGPKGNPRPEQWQHKPSLYAAGADMLCDLMGLRAEFAADLDAWKQLGAKEGVFVMVCKLYSRATGELQAEGRGVRRDGQKGGDSNNAIKMAQKSAKVDAVLNCYGLRDLYGQDLDVPAQPPADNPEAHPDAPTAEPRAQRQAKPDAPPQEVSKGQCAYMLGIWRGTHPQKDGDLPAWDDQWRRWVVWATSREFKPQYSAQWTRADLEAVCGKLGIQPEDVK